VIASNSGTPSLVFNPRGERTRLWDAATGRPLRSLPVRADALAFSPDGKTLATGERGGSVWLRLWDVHTGKEKWCVHGSMFRDTFLGAAFTSDGRAILWAREKKDNKGERERILIERLDAATGRCLGQSTEPGGSAVWAVFSPDCSLVAHDGGWTDHVRGPEEASFLRLLDARTGKPLWSRPRANPDVIAVARFSTDRRRLLIGSFDGWLSLYEVATGQPAWRVGLFNRRVTATAFSPDGRLLAVADTRRRAKSVTEYLADEDWLRAAKREGFAVDRDAKAETAVRLWALPAGRQPPVRLEWDGARVLSLVFSSDGRRLAGGLSDGTVLVWDVRCLLRKED